VIDEKKAFAAFYGMGDRNFTSEYHHGTHEERHAIFRSGFVSLAKDIATAYDEGLRVVDNPAALADLPQREDDLKARNLVGKWGGSSRQVEKQTTTSLFESYSQDGGFRVELAIESPQGNTRSVATARWKVSDGFLVLAIESSDFSHIRAGETIRRRILWLNKDTYRMDDGIGGAESQQSKVRD